MCNGEDAKCPSRKRVKDGALCSVRPWGLFSPVDDARGRDYDTKGDNHKGHMMADEQARDEGLHKCGKCSFGVCVPPPEDEEDEEEKTSYRGDGDDSADYSKHSTKGYNKHRAGGYPRRSLLESVVDNSKNAEVMGRHKHHHKHHHKGWAYCKATAEDSYDDADDDDEEKEKEQY